MTNDRQTAWKAGLNAAMKRPRADVRSQLGDAIGLGWLERHADALVFHPDHPA